MLSLYQANGLVHWTERDIRLREMMIAHFAGEVSAFLKTTNPAWDIRRVEAPILTPRELISQAYGDADVIDAALDEIAKALERCFDIEALARLASLGAPSR